MTYAIRFLPANPARRDEPAAYLSLDSDEGYSPGPGADEWCRLTSVAEDVDCYATEAIAANVCFDDDVCGRCEYENLVADVVPLADALADCADVEPRPRSAVDATEMDIMDRADRIRRRTRTSG